MCIRDSHKVGCGGLVHIQNVADDGIAGHLLGCGVCLFCEHIENIKHDSFSFLFWVRYSITYCSSICLLYTSQSPAALPVFRFMLKDLPLSGEVALRSNDGEGSLFINKMCIRDSFTPGISPL